MQCKAPWSYLSSSTKNRWESNSIQSNHRRNSTNLVKRCEKMRRDFEVRVVYNPSLLSWVGQSHPAKKFLRKILDFWPFLNPLWHKMSAGMTKIPQWHIDISSSRMERTDSWDRRPNNGAVAHPEACHNGGRCRRANPFGQPGNPRLLQASRHTLRWAWPWATRTPISQEKLWFIKYQPWI